MNSQFLDTVLTQAFWSNEYFGNNLRGYLFSLVILIAVVLVLKIFQLFILRHLEKIAQATKTELDDQFIKIFKSIKPPFYFFIAFYIALQQLTFNDLFQKAITVILIIWVVFQVIKAVDIMIDYVVSKRSADEDDKSTRSAIALLSTLTKGILWVLGGLLILSNLGVDITSLIAGLGIGGIAIALALQNILSDLFSSFAIHFDKPFSVGDFIVVGEKMGTVEKIGIKTTRLKALQGEEIVISNKELTTAQIQNFKRMEERRVVFTIGAVYDTPTEKLHKGMAHIKSIIEETEHARFDRVHFREFGDFSLKIEVVYYIQSSDYYNYMDVHQTIHLGIKDAFDKEGIAMAFPTQTVILNKE